jgi:O-antigen/teichoic acid export membrane protein
LFGLHTMLNLRMDRAFFMVTAIGSVIGLGLNLILVNRFAHIGAAYALVFTELYITVAMYGYLRWKGYDVVKLSHLHEAIAFTKARVQTLLNRKPSI